MSLYTVDIANNTVCVVPETDFRSQNVYERYNIQEWVEKSPEMLGEPLLIVAKEFSAFDKTSERADLVALDKGGNIVIIELKRDNSGADVHWQAIKYASYFSRIGFEEISKVHARYHNIEIEKAKEKIQTFVSISNQDEINSGQRIILVSHRFAPEVTSAALWLNQKGLDICCIEMVPYAIDGKMIIQVQKLIPVIGSENFEITVMVGDEEVPISKQDNQNASDQVTSVLRSVYEKTLEALKGSGLNPSRCSRWAGKYYDLRYFKFWFDSPRWANHRCSFQLHIHTTNEDAQYLSAKFVIDKPWASQIGMKAEEIKLLAEKLNLLKDDASVFVENDSFIALEKYFPKQSLTDCENVVSLLKNLVETVHPIIEKKE